MGEYSWSVGSLGQYLVKLIGNSINSEVVSNSAKDIVVDTELFTVTRDFASVGLAVIKMDTRMCMSKKFLILVSWIASKSSLFDSLVAIL